MPQESLRSLDSLHRKLMHWVHDTSATADERFPNYFTDDLSFWSQLLLNQKALIFEIIIWSTLSLVTYMSLPLLLNICLESLQRTGPISSTFLPCVVFSLTSMLSEITHRRSISQLEQAQTIAHHSLSRVLFSKTLHIQSSSQERSSGEIVNLMSTDVSKVAGLYFTMYNFVTASCKISITFFFFLYWMRLSGILASTILILAVPLNWYTYRRQEQIQVELNTLGDERSKTIHEMVSTIKIVKMFCWEKLFSQKIDSTRSRELVLYREKELLNGIIFMMWHSTPFFICASSLSLHYFLTGGQTIPVSVCFSVMALAEHCLWPLTQIPGAFMGTMDFICARRRLMSYFVSREVHPMQVEHMSHYALSVKGSFSWKKFAKPDLKNLNLTVPRGEFLCVTGEVGSGKSSLLQAIISEMLPHDSLSRISLGTDSLAYVSENHWIQSDTIRANIVYDSKHFDEQRYNACIQACCLSDQMSEFPLGDHTVVGARGIRLSGGQQARIALCRAVHADKEIYLLDSILSAVDSTMRQELFQNVIQGLLKEKTIIMCTHFPHLLPYADRVVVMQGGQIAEIGTYSQLLTHRDSYLHRIVGERSEGGDGGLHAGATTPVDLCAPISNASNAVTSGSDKEESPHSTTSSHFKDCMRNLFQYLKLGSKSLIFVVIGCQLANSFLSSLSQYFLGTWAENGKKEQTTPSQTSLTAFLGWYIFFGLLSVIVNQVANYCVTTIMLPAAASLHSMFVHSLTHAPMGFFVSTPTGQIVSRFCKDMKVVDAELVFWVREAILVISSLLMSIAVACYLSWSIFITLVCGIVVVYRIQQWHTPIATVLSKKISSLNEPVYNLFGEVIPGLQTIRAFSSQNHHERAMRSNLLALLSAEVSDRQLQELFTLISRTTAFGFLTLCFYLLGRSEMGIAFIAVSLTRCISISHEMEWCVEILSGLAKKMASVERIFAQTSITPEHYDPPRDVAVLPPVWPTHGVITFDSCCLKYNSSDSPALENLSMAMGGEARRLNAVVGTSGAGKSTLFNALFRLYELDQGKILIDGVDIAHLSLTQLRSSMCIIAQNPVLLRGTLRSNLDPEARWSDQVLWNGLHETGMKTRIQEMEYGLDALVEEGGTNFSAGEKQLLVLSRALLQQKKIICLDEFSSNLSKGRDHQIQRVIRECFKECTIVTIAHRLSSIIDYDHVFVMDRGCLVESGSPQELLQSKGVFWRMVQESGSSM